MSHRAAPLTEAIAMPLRTGCRHGRGRRWAWAVGILLLVALAVVGVLSPVGTWIEGFRGWVEQFGAWGVAVFALAYVLATIALLPCAPLSIVAGLAYGIWAFPLVIASAMTGASLAFHIGRHLARNRVRSWAQDHPRGAAVIDAVGEQGWKIVLLLRLSPLVPFNVQNYLFGITSIRFAHYAVATAIGILPGAALFISVGAFGHGAEDDEGRILNWLLFGVGLAATALAAVLVSRTVMAKLRETKAAP
ncbi:TVP38/TMEM64 family protein [Vineibacter terrae]|uniref:TVP38/TMEM64 family membrane protein n=1 Tax=Vineibacter terrae TaxID=2586908 RepID=A0A5C8PB69_9HYPH|nr:TVP38/TMEM64 family protein [Vineibacter terrae]TXL70795.1 TVP38/TMEM64 family protein [Vineibacter terrae]